MFITVCKQSKQSLSHGSMKNFLGDDNSLCIWLFVVSMSLSLSPVVETIETNRIAGRFRFERGAQIVVVVMGVCVIVIPIPTQPAALRWDYGFDSGIYPNPYPYPPVCGWLVVG